MDWIGLEAVGFLAQGDIPQKKTKKKTQNIDVSTKHTFETN